MNRERRCLATAIYFEAREGPVQRQIGVGQVILNRVRSPRRANAATLATNFQSCA
jgi:spore germination cell wall hydrolase CwlJ-like protein